MYLKRDHDVTMSASGIWRILKRLDMNRLPSSQRYKRHRDRWTLNGVVIDDAEVFNDKLQEWEHFYN